METIKKSIDVEVTVNASVVKVWKYYTEPKHILNWNTASEDWHTTKSENDLKVGGKFLSRMEAKDGSFGFDFEGLYDEVKTNELIAYTLNDGRKAKIAFTSVNDSTIIDVVFEAENQNSTELQQNGWQAILNSFKNYTETN
ncbi:SRPBCC family protein [Flavobacterium sp.]|uniref:SRPBCC family protein n=1 Tax=Flavobacterium sp. TaxID=239 RepID=UPI00286A15DA|nr:SRPBCC family protein [Flavobacterium sp.]